MFCETKHRKNHDQSPPEDLGSDVRFDILRIHIFEVGQSVETLEEVWFLRAGWTLLIFEIEEVLELLCGVCLEGVC